MKFWSMTKNEKKNSGELLLYGPISSTTWWGDEVTPKQFADDLKALGDIDTIDVRINSEGGDVFAGQAIHSMLKRHKAAVTVYVDGLAASIASVIAMAGDTIVMPKNAMMMIHNPWTFTYGNANELREMADTLDQIRKSLIAAYQNKVAMTDEELIAIMDEEKWLTAEEAVELGFADKVEDDKEIAASIKGKTLFCNGREIDLTKYAKAPQVKVEEDIPADDGDSHSDILPNDNKGDDLSMTEQEIRAAAEAAERQRVTDILNIQTQFRNVGVELNVQDFIQNSVSADDVRKKAIDMMAAANPPVPSGRVEVKADERDKFKAAAEDALAMRCGLKVEKPADGANELRGASLYDLAKESVTRAGITVPSYDRVATVRAALGNSSSDFPNILSNVANKSMMTAYTMAPVTYPTWTKRGNLSDYKVASRLQVSEFDKLREVGEGAEYKQVALSEAKETIQIKKYGEIFSITREAIINDDLQALSDIPAKFGAAARFTVESAVYSILTTNGNMADGVALFEATTHKNYTSTGTALSVTSLGVAQAAMKKQKGLAGKQTLNISPAYLIIPVGLEVIAAQLLASIVDPSKNNAAVNPFANKLTPVACPILDDTSTVSWYLAAAPGFIDTVEVAFLNGQDTPYLEQRMGFEVDGVEFKVRHEFGAKALDFRGLYKNAGA